VSFPQNAFDLVPIGIADSSWKFVNVLGTIASAPGGFESYTKQTTWECGHCGQLQTAWIAAIQVVHWEVSPSANFGLLDL